MKSTETEVNVKQRIKTIKNKKVQTAEPESKLSANYQRTTVSD